MIQYLYHWAVVLHHHENLSITFCIFKYWRQLNAKLKLGFRINIFLGKTIKIFPRTLSGILAKSQTVSLKSNQDNMLDDGKTLSLLSKPGVITSWQTESSRLNGFWIQTDYRLPSQQTLLLFVVCYCFPAFVCAPECEYMS